MEKIDVLASFLPPMVIRRCVEDREPLQEPFRRDFSGAALFADISGFTRLAESLSQKASDGGEELTAILNGYFGKLIGLISAHGGEVVKFAGDALLAVWLVPAGTPTAEKQERLREVTVRAAQCGLAIQQTFPVYQATPDVVLTLRIGVGAGEMAEVYLGGTFHRWEFLLTGSPLEQIGVAGEQGAPGEIVVSAEAAALIRSHFDFQERKNGAIRLTGVVLPLEPSPLKALPVLAVQPDVLRAYVPGAIRARLDAGQSAWIGELRRITILFINLPDLKFHTPLQNCQRVMRSLQEAMYSVEGSINKLSIDEKGVTLVAALGLPPLAHEDDAARGVLAALLVQKSLGAQQVRSSVGISRGRVFCGVVGNEQRREYTVIGNIVNLSARLMQAAKGGIMCDEVTFQAAHGRIEFETLTPISLKGMSGAVAVFRPKGVARHTSTRNRLPLIGRTEEMTVFCRLLDDLGSARNTSLSGATGKGPSETLPRENLQGRGQSRCLILEGEPGVGKSRLTDEMKDRARENGFPVLFAWGDPLLKDLPYVGWRQVLQEFLGLVHSLPPPERLREMVLARWAGVVPDFQDWAPVLNGLLPMDLPDSPTSRDLIGEGRGEKIREILLAILRHEVRTPWVMFFEDAHWIDASSLLLSRLVGQELAPLLIVLVTRPVADPPSPVWGPLLDQPGLTRMRLTGFPPDESIRFVASLLQVDQVQAEVNELVGKLAGGNPLFLEEAVLALREAGVLLFRDGNCALAPQVGREVALPFAPTIEGAISGRLDRLTPQQQLALKVASVQGRTFQSQVVQDVYPLDEDRSGIPGHLDNLTRAGLTLEDQPWPEASFQFKHILTREVAYRQMLHAQRRELHRAVAEWYERHNPAGGSVGTAPSAAGGSALAPMLAHHWECAEEFEKAAVALAVAGGEAFREGAYHESGAFLDRLLELADKHLSRSSPATRAGWHLQRGLAAYCIGDFPKGFQHFGETLRFLGRPLPIGAVQLYVQSFREFLVHLASRLFGISRLTSRLPGETDDHLALAAEALVMIGGMAQMNNDSPTALYGSLRFLNLAELAGSRGLGFQVMGNAIMALIAGAIFGVRVGDLYARRARNLRQGQDLMAKQAEGDLLLGQYELSIGRLARSCRSFQASAREANRTGVVRLWEEAALHQALAEICRGRMVPARRLLEELFIRSRRVRDFQSLNHAYLLSALLDLRLGNLASAQQHLTTAAANISSNSDQLGHLLFLGISANFAGLSGQDGAAEKYATEFFQVLSSETAPSFFPIFAQGMVAEADLLAVERSVPAVYPDRLKINLDKCRLGAANFPVVKPMFLLLSGWWARLRQEFPRAHRLLTEAAALAREMGLFHEEGLALIQLGKIPPTPELAGFVPASFHTRAVEVFSRAGADPAALMRMYGLVTPTADLRFPVPRVGGK